MLVRGKYVNNAPKAKKYHIEKGHRKHKIRKITLLQLGTEEFILKAVRNSDAKSRILSEKSRPFIA